MGYAGFFVQALTIALAERTLSELLARGAVVSPRTCVFFFRTHERVRARCRCMDAHRAVGSSSWTIRRRSAQKVHRKSEERWRKGCGGALRASQPVRPRNVKARKGL